MGQVVGTLGGNHVAGIGADYRLVPTDLRRPRRIAPRKTTKIFLGEATLGEENTNAIVGDVGLPEANGVYNVVFSPGVEFAKAPEFVEVVGGRSGVENFTYAISSLTATSTLQTLSNVYSTEKAMHSNFSTHARFGSWANVPDWQRTLIDDLRVAQQKFANRYDEPKVPDKAFVDAIRFINLAVLPTAQIKKPKLVFSSEDQELSLLWESKNLRSAVYVWFLGDGTYSWSKIDVPNITMLVSDLEVTSPASRTLITSLFSLYDAS